MRPSTRRALAELGGKLADKAALDAELLAAEALLLRIRRALELNEEAIGRLERTIADDAALRGALELEASR